MRTSSIICLIVAMTAASAAFADTSVVRVQPQYDCITATKIKFDQKLYESKAPSDQRQIDARYQQCKIDEEAATTGRPPGERVIIIANPTPTGEQDRVFYGIIKTADLNNAEKNCKGGGMAAGIVLSVVGTSAGMPGAAQAGGMIYEYSDVTCNGLSDAIRGDNLMVALVPTQVIASAIGNKIIKDIVEKIPLVSDADKKAIKDTLSSANEPPKVKVTKDKVHIDIGIGGGVGIKKPW